MTEQEDRPKYKAPALAKGIAILELLAKSSEPLTLSGISDSLDRSRNEIFRMVQDLQTLGYIRRSTSDDGYELTNRLFTLGIEQPKVASLLEVALPEMRRFAKRSGQSCHIATPFDGEFVVIARIESPGDTSFAVRVGVRHALHQGASGMVLFAHQPSDVQEEWRELIATKDPDFNASILDKKAVQIKKDGYYSQRSNFVDGVMDVGAPIISGGRAIASLTSPCITKLARGKKLPLPIEELIDAAVKISAGLSPK
ncbi:MAG: IclR family transcriptional regulator [Pseudomonadota bacterium]